MDSILLDLEFFSQMGTEAHMHADLEIMYVIKGNARVEIADQTWNMTSHEYILINANLRHALNVGEDSLVGVFHLPYLMISNCVGNDHFSITINSADGDDDHNNEEILSILQEIFNSGADHKSIFSNYCLYYRLLEILTGAYLKIDVADRHGSCNTLDNRLLEIKDYISRYYYQNISLNDLASRLFLSPSYLSKYFKNHFGINFLQPVIGK